MAIIKEIKVSSGRLPLNLMIGKKSSEIFKINTQKYSINYIFY